MFLIELKGGSQAHRDEADPQAGNDADDGPKSAQIEWSGLKVLVVDEPH